jgi:adenosine deaminase
MSDSQIKWVELHIHLCGSVRWQRVYERTKLLKLDGHELSEDEFRESSVSGPHCTDLADFCSKFYRVFDALRGCASAVEEAVVEVCEGRALQNVAWFELRVDVFKYLDRCDDEQEARQLVKAVCDGLRRGCSEFDTQGGIVLNTTWRASKYAMRVVQLANEFREHGVVGVDIAGNEEGAPPTKEHEAAFQCAAELGIRRTVHRGWAGSDIRHAIDVLHAERIGHGYAVADDDALAGYVRERGIHIEASLTPACHFDNFHVMKRDACKKLSAANIDWALSTDDPVIKACDLRGEEAIAREHVGLSHQQLLDMQVRAIDASFAPASTRASIRKELAALARQAK